MRADITIPMHYGMFDLSDKPLRVSSTVFAAEARKKGNIRVKIPALGEVVRIE